VDGRIFKGLPFSGGSKRWRELAEFLISTALLRRPRREHDGLLAAAVEACTDPARKEEIRTMFERLEQCWEAELLAHGRAEGALQNCREVLWVLLEDRFGPLPNALAHRIERTQNQEQFMSCIRQVRNLNSLDDLQMGAQCRHQGEPKPLGAPARNPGTRKRACGGRPSLRDSPFLRYHRHNRPPE
jgi:hypothetical protein